MYLSFKAPLCAEWGVSDSGITVKNRFYSWKEISSISIINNPKNSLTNGVYQVNIGKKAVTLVFPFGEKDSAHEAFLFIKSCIQGQYSGLEDPASSHDQFSELVLFQESILSDLKVEASSIIPPNEVVYVALKGAFKEYLFCTDRMVYIYKKGFMTGHTFGVGAFNMPYSNITNAEVDYHLTTGYFELSSGGLKNKPLNYWDNKGNSPQKAPNAISITGSELRSLFDEAAHFIMRKTVEEKTPKSIVKQAPSDNSFADQIRDLKSLLDDGLITPEEFDMKKRQILNV
jgi:hypothetical protein